MLFFSSLQLLLSKIRVQHDLFLLLVSDPFYVWLLGVEFQVEVEVEADAEVEAEPED